MWGPLSVQVAKLNSRTTLIAMLYTFDAHTPPSIFKHCNSRINCHSYSFVSTRSLKTTVQLLFEPYTNSYTRSNRRRRRTASFRHERSTRSSLGDSPHQPNIIVIISPRDAQYYISRRRIANPFKTTQPIWTLPKFGRRLVSVSGYILWPAQLRTSISSTSSTISSTSNAADA
jgi:hypothetical protein